MRKENGALYFKENWFLKYFWGFNFNTLFIGEREYPKNLCSLFWGSLLGIFISTPVWFTIFVIGISVFFVFRIIGGFFGFYPAPKEAKGMFGPYKHWGKKRIPIAAWEVFLLFAGIYVFFSTKYGTENILYILSIIADFFLNSTVLAILIGVGVVAGILFFLFKTTPGKVVREYIKAAKRKVCPLVVVERK